jgi:hypothetical protein
MDINPPERPTPKKFCCEEMAAAWKQSHCGWSGHGVAVRVVANWGHSITIGSVLIAFCPWCEFRLKVKGKRKEECVK